MGYKKYSKYPRERREDYMDNTTFSDHSKGPNNEGDIDVRIGLKGRSSLPKSTYAIKADPYEAALPTANPYDLIAPFNRTAGGTYAGTDNLDGGNVQQYANSYTSQCLKAFDFTVLKLAVNYRFIPRLLAPNNVPVVVENKTTHVKSIKHDPDYIGSGLIDMQRQSIAEATSVLQATTFTQMAVNYYAVESDLPVGHAEMYMTTGDKVILKDLPDVIYATSSFYQIFWQEAISVVSWFNSFRLKQGTMIRSSWNRETPTLNSLFGLFNKKAFLSLLDSICLSFEGEYIDKEWTDQYNLLSFMPSRRTNSIHDPVMEIQTRHQHPNHFKLHLIDENGDITGEPVFDLEDDLVFADVDNEQDITFFAAVNELKDMLSATSLMRWARDATLRESKSQNDYYNRVVFLLDIIQDSCTIMKVKFNDIREVYDVISRTGLNSWVKKFRPAITKSNDAALFDNLIINDIYRTVFSGATEISIDPSTKRWRSYTMWDMYDGVPAYDASSGGCFLTFSGKKINSGSDTDKIRQWVPIAFYVDSTDAKVTGEVAALYAVNRSGTYATITPEEYNMADTTQFSRLVPLMSQGTINVRVPSVNNISDKPSASFLANMLCNIFGYCCVNNEIYIDPDLLYAYELEISDVTNDAIRYARINSPFRGAAPEGDIIGFAKFGQS